MTYVKRIIEKAILKANANFPVVMLTGPRQVGKTTVFQNCDKNRKYVSLDKLANRRMAIEDPDLFLQKYSPPVLIDEVQYAPNLFSVIKADVDTRKENGMYWLTGSQQFHLMKHVSETLAGRIAILNMQGFSQQERYDVGQLNNVFLDTKQALAQNPTQISLMDLYKAIWKGSCPKMVCSDDDYWELYYSSYLQSYIERDIRDLGAISDELVFLKFMRAIAARTGQLLNCSDIAKDVGISAPTVTAWISILRTSGIIYLLEPYYSNLSKRMTKMPKIYFLDTGLACYLTNWQNHNALESGAMNGAIFETYVVSEILKSFWFSGKRAPIFFYRDKDKREIDIILENNGKLIPVEIKKKTTPDKSDIKNFDIIDYETGFVVCLAPSYSFVTDKVKAIPVGYL
ncbi:MAG: ATP-binding protein [Alphaproteobacteria bacterium]|nr:ATP-binding protein [Alphaproteobacteria bacterium]